MRGRHGTRHTIVRLANGELRAFGGNAQGQLGIGELGGSRSLPAKVLLPPPPAAAASSAVDTNLQSAVCNLAESLSVALVL